MVTYKQKERIGVVLCRTSELLLLLWPFYYCLIVAINAIRLIMQLLLQLMMVNLFVLIFLDQLQLIGKF